MQQLRYLHTYPKLSTSFTTNSKREEKARMQAMLRKYEDLLRYDRRTGAIMPALNKPAKKAAAKLRDNTADMRLKTWLTILLERNTNTEVGKFRFASVWSAVSDIFSTAALILINIASNKIFQEQINCIHEKFNAIYLVLSAVFSTVVCSIVAYKARKYYYRECDEFAAALSRTGNEIQKERYRHPNV